MRSDDYLNIDTCEYLELFANCEDPLSAAEHMIREGMWPPELEADVVAGVVDVVRALLCRTGMTFAQFDQLCRKQEPEGGRDLNEPGEPMRVHE